MFFESPHDHACGLQWGSDIHVSPCIAPCGFIQSFCWDVVGQETNKLSKWHVGWALNLVETRWQQTLGVGSRMKMALVQVLELVHIEACNSGVVASNEPKFLLVLLKVWTGLEIFSAHYESQEMKPLGYSCLWNSTKGQCQFSLWKYEELIAWTRACLRPYRW